MGSLLARHCGASLCFLMSESTCGVGGVPSYLTTPLTVPLVAVVIVVFFAGVVVPSFVVSLVVSPVSFFALVSVFFVQPTTPSIANAGINNRMPIIGNL